MYMFKYSYLNYNNDVYLDRRERFQMDKNVITFYVPVTY